MNFRYIRYRDGTEELYDHRVDPNEHHNLANDPRYAEIKEKLAAFLPKKNVVPKSMRDGGLDPLGQKAQELLRKGIPDWLGKIPKKYN